MGREMQLERHFGTHLANTVARLGERDCLVTFSFWWLPRQVLEATQIARELGGEHTRQAVERSEAVWARMGLFDVPD